jgi:hypothetical protein
MKNWIRFVVPALLVAAGIGLLVNLAIASKAASRTDQWSQAIGRIETVAIRPNGVELSYRYEVGGTTHANPRGVLTVRNNPGEAALRSRYAPGRSVLIYVNPADAAESILEHPARPSYWPLYAAVFLIPAGIALALYAWRHPAKAVPPKVNRTASPPLSRLRPPPSVKRT